MMKFVAATKAGLCPAPWDFFRHGNRPKKSEKEKAEAKRSDFFGLLLEYSLTGCVPVLPLSVSSSMARYIAFWNKPNGMSQKENGLPSVAASFKLATKISELEAQNNQETNHA